MDQSKCQTWGFKITIYKPAVAITGSENWCRAYTSKGQIWQRYQSFWTFCFKVSQSISQNVKLLLGETLVAIKLSEWQNSLSEKTQTPEVVSSEQKQIISVFTFVGKYIRVVVKKWIESDKKKVKYVAVGGKVKKMSAFLLSAAPSCPRFQSSACNLWAFFWAAGGLSFSFGRGCSWISSLCSSTGKQLQDFASRSNWIDLHFNAHALHKHWSGVGSCLKGLLWICCQTLR